MSVQPEKGIINGQVYLKGEFVTTNIYFDKGLVSCLTTDRLDALEEIDAMGKWVLPGFIDPHVHFHLGVGESLNEDDFVAGSQKGLLGGITTYIDFLDPVKAPEAVLEAWQKRMALAQQSASDYAFHGTVANPKGAAKDMLSALKDQGITSVKLFTTYANTDRRTYDHYILDLLRASALDGSKIVIHAENDDLIDKDSQILVNNHEAARPALSERTEVLKLAEMAKSTGGHLYIVHVSAGSTVEMLCQQYGKQLENGIITLESCPHYFIFNSEIYGESKGYLYTMTPPLRPETDRRLLGQYLKYIHTIGTDHCPYPASQKCKTYTSQIPMGIGGITYSFLNMYTLFGRRVLDQYTQNPAKAYGLYPKKGVLLPGSDADVVIFDPNGQTKVLDPDSIYNGFELKGAIEHVFLRGKQVVNHGHLVPSRGEYIRR